jgi:hypothetical protein
MLLGGLSSRLIIIEGRHKNGFLNPILSETKDPRKMVIMEVIFAAAIGVAPRKTRKARIDPVKV